MQSLKEDVLKRYHLIDSLGVVLSPYLSLLGLSRKAAPVTLVGMTLGLVWWALLLEEIKSGELSDKDHIFSITSMNLFHSIIEDTVIIVFMGGALSWLLIPRLLWTLLVMRIIIIVNKLNQVLITRIINRQRSY